MWPVHLSSLVFITAFVSAFSSSSSSYDYVVVGGGTCGLVVANRLSEHANISVLIIEAGGPVYDNVDVTDPNGYGRAFNTGIDWQYKTEPQVFADSGIRTLHASKALGGTSTINGIASNSESCQESLLSRSRNVIHSGRCCPD